MLLLFSPHHDALFLNSHQVQLAVRSNLMTGKLLSWQLLTGLLLDGCFLHLLYQQPGSRPYDLPLWIMHRAHILLQCKGKTVMNIHGHLWPVRFSIGDTVHQKHWGGCSWRFKPGGIIFQMEVSLQVWCRWCVFQRWRNGRGRNEINTKWDKNEENKSFEGAAKRLVQTCMN